MTGALVIGLSAGAFLLFSVLDGEEAGSQDEDFARNSRDGGFARNSQDEDFARNSEFIRQGRPDVSLCVSDYTSDSASASELSARLQSAIDHNKRNLWKNSFLEVEDVTVESPWPNGPTVSEATADVMQYLGGIEIVDQPGRHVVHVHVVDASVLAALDRLHLGRVLTQELIDLSPNQLAGYQQHSAGIYLSRDEFEQPAFLARQVAEALGCTEGCARPTAHPDSGTDVQP